MLLCQHGKGERVGDGPPPVRTVGGSRLILRLFTFKLKRKKKTSFNFKSYTYNIVHLSGCEQGSLCFAHSETFFIFLALI